MVGLLIWVGASGENECKLWLWEKEKNFSCWTESASSNFSICKCNRIGNIFTDARIWSCKRPTQITINSIEMHAVLESRRNKDLAFSNTLDQVGYHWSWLYTTSQCPSLKITTFYNPIFSYIGRKTWDTLIPGEKIGVEFEWYRTWQRSK